MTCRVRVRRDGPYVIEGEDVEVVDWEGKRYEITRRPVALCRCGQSAHKPFCDKTHKLISFRGDKGADETLR